MDESPTPLQMLLVIAVTEIIRATRAPERQRVLAGIDRTVGDPRVVPIHDGDHLRLSAEMRRLYEALLPLWLA
jgi:hypothetical protein